MRTLIISDIHANKTALEAVLKDAGEVDSTYCLGDVVGYGPDPNECVERLLDIPDLTWIIGNHDAAVLGRIDINTFNYEAKMSLQWQNTTFKSANKKILETLPESLVIGDITLAHGSPCNPIWEYILDARTAKSNFSYYQTRFCLVGHTHLPCIYEQNKDGHVNVRRLSQNEEICLTNRSIINPGSVGQPRDRNPLAAYMIFESENLTWQQRRVAYDVAAVQERILSNGLPTVHAFRLRDGF